MHHTVRTLEVGRIIFYAFAAAGLLSSCPVLAQDNGYRIGENRPAPPSPVHPRSDAPTRLARIEYVSGKVTWRPDSGAKWENAGTNRPLKDGAQLWVEDRGRAEVRFDDGSILRLGSNAVVTIKTLFVDREGEYTNIKMLSGIATLLPREERSVFEVSTPFISVKTVGPSRLRIGVGDDIEVAVSKGHASLDGPQGKITLNSGDFVSQRSSDAAYAIHSLPEPDSWEIWNDERDRKLAAEAHPAYHPHRWSDTYTSIFISLGFPIYPSYRHEYRPYYGRGAYRHR